MVARWREDRLFGGGEHRLGGDLVATTLAHGAGGTAPDARLAQDGPDGAGAASAFGTAAEAAINLTDATRAVRSVTEAGPDVMIAQDVAVTDDHSGSPLQSSEASKVD